MNHLQSEKGVSLIMTLVLLIVVSVLVGAFMSSSVSNIDFSQEQLDQKRAFYAAEAGIEHLLSKNLSSVESLANIDISDVFLNDNIYYNVEYDQERSTKDLAYFTSDGYVDREDEERNERIEIKFSTGDKFNAINFNRVYDQDEKHYNLAGGEDYADEYINITQFNPEDLEEWALEHSYTKLTEKKGPGIDLDPVINDNEVIDDERIVAIGSIHDGGGLKIKNSVLIITESFHVTGEISFIDSIIIILGDSNLPQMGEEYLFDSGTPATSFSIEEFDEEVLEGLEELLDDNYERNWKFESWSNRSR